MESKQGRRSEETKNSILSAAGKLFAKQGYDTVTMREIAKEAGCSHTTIYIYFKDKEALLDQLSMPSLQELQEQMEYISKLEALTPEEKLKGMSSKFILFCMENQSMYAVFLGANATRVDEDPELEINKVRIGLFRLLMAVIQQCLLIDDQKKLLTYTRIFFYNLHGSLATYIPSKESTQELMDRLLSTFDIAVDILLTGFIENNKQGGVKE